MIFLNLLLIQIIISAVGYTGFWEEGFEPAVKKLFGIKVGTLPKIAHCPLCQSWWVSLFYLIFSGNLTLPYIAAALILAILTPVTQDLINFAKDLLTGIITFFYEILNI